MNKLFAMQAFVALADTGSFTQAAAHLRVTKGRMTQLIGALEVHLGTQLLIRTTRKVAVTAEGRLFAEHARGVLASVEQAEASVGTRRGDLRGRVRVDVPSVVAGALLIPALPAFHDAFPGIRVELGVTDRIVDVFAEGVDCVVRGGETVGAGLRFRRIGEVRMVACAAPDYLRRHGVPGQPGELAGPMHHTVGFFSATSNRVLPFKFWDGGAAVSVQSNYVLAVNNGDSYLAAAVAGLGVIRAPEVLVADELKRGRLQRVLANWDYGVLPLFVGYPETRKLPARVRVFIDWLVETLAGKGAPRP